MELDTLTLTLTRLGAAVLVLSCYCYFFGLGKQKLYDVEQEHDESVETKILASGDPQVHCL